MNNYYDVYWQRVGYRGLTMPDITQNEGERSFNRWLKTSPHTLSLSIERGLHFKGIILNEKDKTERKIMTLNVSRNVPLQIGDIVNWTESGTTEKWLIFQKERVVREAYQVFYIIRCNYLLKWIDNNGFLKSSWCYFVSSQDSKIKENFRT